MMHQVAKETKTPVTEGLASPPVQTDHRERLEDTECYRKGGSGAGKRVGSLGMREAVV